MIPKFRAYSKADNAIYKVLLIDFKSSIEQIKLKKTGEIWYDFEDVVLMQSTGIKGKNGVEIYEGDILKLHAIFLAPDDKIGYLEYSPKYGYSIILEGNRLYRQEYWASTNKLNYEVIGNIYENPELLEDV
ncbi:YopX family protein [Lactococcus piscium]|uniref:Phage protein n=1 Tax=Pseudolactococcus piscium MKFS47 TaxID=297352 RepID=A0A0D6DYY7_9LACT|nr:YopX family protein [Lactococcus piscium]CEN29157.1 Phage protein [Lactococcus piscium MKFS47]